MAKTYN